MVIIDQFGLGWWSACSNLRSPFALGLFKFLFRFIESTTAATKLNTRKVSVSEPFSHNVNVVLLQR